MQFKFGLLITVLFTFATISLGAEKTSIQGIAQRVQLLEGQSKNLEQSIENKKVELKNLSDQQRNDLEKRSEELSQELKKGYSTLWLFVVVGIPGTLVAVIVAIITAVLTIRSYVTKKISEEIDRLIHDKRSKLIELVSSSERDDKLKRQWSIFVLTPHTSDSRPLQEILSGAGFQKVHYLDENDEVVSDGESVALFNDSDACFDKGLLQRLLVQLSPNVIRFYYGPDRIHVPEAVKGVTGFANAHEKLCVNLLDLLRHHD